MNKELMERLKQRDAKHEKVMKEAKAAVSRVQLGDLKGLAAKKLAQQKQMRHQQQTFKPGKQKYNKSNYNMRNKSNQVDTVEKLAKVSKSKGSTKLEQWRKAMEDSKIHETDRWQAIEDRISKLSGTERKEMEREIFAHKKFQLVYRVGDKDDTDEYLSYLEEVLDEYESEGPVNNFNKEGVMREVASQIKDYMMTRPSNATLAANILKQEIETRNIAKQVEANAPEIFKTISTLTASKTNLATPKLDFIINSKKGRLVTKSGNVINYGQDLSNLSNEEIMDLFDDLEYLGIEI